MIRNFFKTLKESIYGPEFYTAVVSKSYLKCAIYLFVLLLIIETVFAVRMLPDMFGFFSAKTVDEVVSVYPNDLVVTLEGGKVSVNKEEPIFIGEVGDDKHKHFLTIDTKTELTGEQLTEYSTGILVKKDLVVIDGGSNTRIFPLKDLDDITITKERFVGWGEKVKPFLLPGAIALGVFLYVMFVSFTLMFQLIYTLIPATIILVAAKLFKKGFSFKTSYKMALYASTLPLLAGFVTHFIGGPMPYLSFTALVLLVVLLNVLPKEKN